MTISVGAIWRQLRKPSGLAQPLLDVREPQFAAGYAGPVPEYSGHLKVVTWNIRLGMLIGEAVKELRAAPLAGADIILLQEMNEQGTYAIARALEYNFVYFAACIHCDTKKNFGNAVLSRWPILSTAKVMFPHVSPRTKENRIATRAVIDVGGQRLLVYGVHTETFHLKRSLRQEQFAALADDIDRQSFPYVLAGGDFNTMRARDIRQLDEALATGSMERVSAGTGPTATFGFFGLRLDHVYTRGTKTLGAGTASATRASDHLALWVEFSLEAERPKAVN